VGVAQQPTVEHVLCWLKGFPSRKPLDRETAERVRAAMKRFPAQIWQNCRHWLSFNNSWEPVESLSYRITGQSLTHRLDLFPHIKERTADVQMLSVDILNDQPFASLPDLGEAIEYRLTPIPDHMFGGATDKPWLACLARMLSRIKTGDVEERQRIRSGAERLERSSWLTLNDHAAIQVTPYIEQTPAGRPLSPLVLWKDTTIFVKDGGSARSFKEVVAELARPFANREIGEAIKACYERDDAFIEDYMSQNFDLDMEISPEGPPITPEVETEEAPDGPPTQEEKDQTGDGGEEAFPPGKGEPVEPKDKGGRREDRPEPPKKSPLFDRYMAKSGYWWSAENQSYIHKDGSRIAKCEAPFHWRQFDAAGNVICSYWVSEQSLARNGIEMNAEVWNFMQNNLLACRLIVVDAADRPLELSGSELMQEVKDGKIELYPAKYRLRLKANIQ